jgi:TonB family protein
LEASLNSRYKGKILALRHPLDKNSQVYGSDGNLQTVGKEESWTLYGRILVKKIVVKKHALHLEGERVIYRFNQQDGLAPSGHLGNVKVEIRFDSKITSAEEANILLARVFALTDDEIIRSAPAFWQPYLRQQAAHTLQAGKMVLPSYTSDATQPEGIDRAAHDGSDTGTKQKVYTIHPGVTAPRAKSTPRPAYTEAARKKRYQGTAILFLIVDETGKVIRPQIVRPLGLGLDDNAVKRVMTWRFEPATIDHKPVAVQISLEVSFRLY